MDELTNIKNKLSEINKYWNKYYFSKEFFQKKINFTDDVKTNYYGDLNNYLHDTLPLVVVFNDANNTEQYISNSIVLLQVVYIQQDLIDELLYIFKIDASSLEDKKPNRTIRNELIGHPISRTKKALNSSILFDIRNRNNKTIKYHKYSKENNFRPVKESYNINEIIERHMIFLNKYLDKIIKQCKQQIQIYKKKIEEVFKIPLDKQFRFIDNIDSTLLSNIDMIFEKENLEYYYSNLKKHRRYLYCLKNYKETLRGVIYERNISFRTGLISDTYTIEQLNKKDSIFNIDFYLKQYQDNNIVYTELLNMKKNINKDKEYYASLNYLTYNSRSHYNG